MPNAQPFQSGDYVEFLSPAHRVDPFLADDVMEVVSLSKSGRGKAIRWRVRVAACNRAASGWVDADSLQPHGGEQW